MMRLWVIAALTVGMPALEQPAELVVVGMEADERR
jgi:hypothetical protein